MSSQALNSNEFAFVALERYKSLLTLGEPCKSAEKVPKHHKNGWKRVPEELKERMTELVGAEESSVKEIDERSIEEIFEEDLAELEGLYIDEQIEALRMALGEFENEDGYEFGQ